MVSDKLMTVVGLLVFCLPALPAFGQSDRDKLSPQQLRQLVASHEQAREELQRAEAKSVAGHITRGFLNNYDSVAMVTIGQVKTGPEDSYDAEFMVERTLRGKVPQQMVAHGYWMPNPKLSWEVRPPPCLQRIEPKPGRRMLAEVVERPHMSGLPEFRCVFGFLDLDDPVEAAYLPQAQAAADMEVSASTAGLVPYEKGLTSDSAAVRDLAFWRLLFDERCPGDSQCEASIHAALRTLLASKNVNERWEAVMWLRDWLQEWLQPIGRCGGDDCDSAQFQPAPIRSLLQTAINDQNVAVGDEAFELLAALDFHKKENAGWCQDVQPEIRAVKRYPEQGEHLLGRTFYCLKPGK